MAQRDLAAYGRFRGRFRQPAFSAGGWQAHRVGAAVDLFVAQKQPAAAGDAYVGAVGEKAGAEPLGVQELLGVTERLQLLGTSGTSYRAAEGAQVRPEPLRVEQGGGIGQCRPDVVGHQVVSPASGRIVRSSGRTRAAITAAMWSRNASPCSALAGRASPQLPSGAWALRS